MTLVYFAYGSNLHSGRLRSRAPGAQALGAARLRGVRLVCNKLGRDGTAKANLEPAPSSHVWGGMRTAVPSVTIPPNLLILFLRCVLSTSCAVSNTMLATA